MFGSLLSVFVASAVVTHALPGAKLPYETSDNAVFQPLERRGIFGPIATDSPAGIAGGEVACGAPPVSSFFAGLNPPFPTNSWWASYAAPPGNETAAGPWPYESALYNDGVVFGISTNRQFDGTSIKQPTQTDWRVSFVEHQGNFANHKATGFDTQTVTVQYFQGSATLTTYLVPGSPYMTFQFAGATPLLTSMNGGITSFNGQTLAAGASTSATGTEFTVVDSSGSTYLIYALSSITLKATAVSSSSGTIQASAAYTGVLRVVKLASASHKALLDQYYQVYPTSVSLDYSFTDTTGTLIFDWTTVGAGSNLLMLTYPHHRIKLQNPNFPATTALGYLTTKGWMYPVIGNQWNLLYTLTSITWDPPRALDSSCSAAVLQGLEYEVAQLSTSTPPVPGDFYYWGGTLAAQARLALIADNLGRSDLVTPVIKYLETSFAYWFESSSSTLPAYETTWGGVVDKAGATNVNIDFGNGYYNDHHFHYGYFLTVAATIAKFDASWLNQHKDYINFFARDIINPSPQDPYFPITRCRDWFAGHSWASGIANGAGSRDQESTGEAVNGYYGALLWASVALSQDYVNYAKLLLATEQHGAQVYWHLYPQEDPTSRDNPYPEAAVLYDTQWVDNVWSYTMPELVDPTIGDEWKCVIIDAYSNANPQVAAEWSANITDWGTGQTFTNELFFIGTRPNTNGAPICGSLPQNPYGSFRIQLASNGNYVAASSANTNLVASATSSSTAAVFSSAYVPNSGTLELVSTSQYVTADISGSFALAAIRGTASTWERFTIRQKLGAASGVYSIKATSNGLWITVGGDGSLINNGASEAASAGFRFVPSASVLENGIISATE
ncbi:hypothetical protein D0Z07_1589 [Hyphodiscus hymeniophilus]|uniref:glucan endo-1,3-beta-D-glucosidase n=1 Tax=Hyphodiscus hymeniophilus TaxID=353542 RepID=A0A9P6VMV1_9HELO|nr:hypothetical protein D0Z07_1589 [Hyphodiscus hymeniophilus]